MNKRIISKVGKRHRPEIDIMEKIQIDDIIEFDLDRDLFDDKPIKKKYQRDVKPDIEQNAEFSVDIENKEVK